QRCSTFGFTSIARATSPRETPCSSRRTAASLKSFVNILLDNPMTQFSFEWILSRNWLCQKWGQVQSQPPESDTWSGERLQLILRDGPALRAVTLVTTEPELYDAMS